MATYRYSSLNNKCVVEIPGLDGTLTAEDAKSRDFQIGEEIGSIGLKPNKTGTLVSVNFPLGYAHDINPVTDTVILAGVTIAANSRTASQLANDLRSSAVFLKPSSGGGGGSFATITGQPTDNAALASVLDAKQDKVLPTLRQIATRSYMTTRTVGSQNYSYSRSFHYMRTAVTSVIVEYPN